MTERQAATWDLLRESFLRHDNERAQTALWAIDVIEGYLGTSWMPTAWRRRELPEFFWYALGHQRSFYELLETALWIKDNDATDGRARVRKACRGHVDRGQLFHARLQLETAALGRMAGFAVALETAQASGYPADVQLSVGTRRLLVECQVVRPPDADIEAGELFDWAGMKLMRLRADHGVDISGELETDKPELVRRDLDDLEVILSVSSGPEPAIVEGWASRLTIRWDATTPGGSIRSVRTPLDLGRHLAGKVDGKQGQLEREASVWLRLDARNGIWQRTHLIHASLEEKMTQLGDYARALCFGTVGIAGIVLSCGSCEMPGVVRGEDLEGADGRRAMRRALPGSRARETIIVPLTDGGLGEVEVWTDLYDREDSWLPAALASRGLPSLNEIFPS